MNLDKKTVQLIKAHGLTVDEYHKICDILKRPPKLTELGIFSVMWSEHCSYKSSKVFLKGLPVKGEKVIQGPGENAGVVDIGDGFAVVFKMESHNHPSFIEPFQGAATGVGGILRDIFTMGARPIALLDSLRFGPLDLPRNRYLLEGVVSGISSYGNCMGVPTVGGDVYFSESYNNNILVNVMCVGLLRKDRVFRARASGIGNPVLYAGSKTGRDGIHGATMASEAFGFGGEERRPTVQVGDPFTEKLLLEACLEAMETGAIIAIQDMGAAGLTSSSVEMANRGGVGIELNLEKVPRREEKMLPYEIMLSESQERMLLVVKKGTEEKVMKIFRKWGVDSCVVGRVTKTGKITVKENGKIFAEIPIEPLANPEPLSRPLQEPEYIKNISNFIFESIREPHDLKTVFLKLLSSPTIASKRWIYGQYDYSVQINTVLGPGADAAVLRVKDSSMGVAMTVDVNSLYCYLNPRRGAAIAVAEAARNLSCVGAEPVGLTDCLNFGSPEVPGVLWQFRECINGIRDACLVLDIPVVSGNVSFYNETNGVPVYPTPTIGMVGLLKDIRKVLKPWFTGDGELIGLFGPWRGEVGGSEYMRLLHNLEAGQPPELDLHMEKRVQRACREAINSGLLESAHDCSEGGIAVTLAECCFGNDVGCNVRITGNGRPDFALFGESQSRIVISFKESNHAQVSEIARRYGIPFKVFGKTGGERFIIEDLIDFSVKEIKNIWMNSLEYSLERRHAEG